MTGESVNYLHDGCPHWWAALDFEAHWDDNATDNEWDGRLEIVWYCERCRTVEREIVKPFVRGQVVESA